MIKSLGFIWMGRRPLKPCNAPGCPELVRGQTYCENHQSLTKERKAAADKYRGSSSSRGYNYRWQKARKEFLSHNPLCIACYEAGIFTPSTVVDHIEPHKGDKVKFWDKSNWQPMCAPCHSKKTASEDGGFGNPQSLS